MKYRRVENGLVHVYTGDGKGKTSAALGLALRAISYRKRVLIVQFIKGPWRSGELNVASRLASYLKIKAMGEGFIKILSDRKPFAVHKQAAQTAWRYAANALRQKKCDVLILDEIIVAIKEKVVTEKQVVDMIKSKPAAIELVLTGRQASTKIKKLADYVSEIKMHKHPYQKGILARPAIDY